jgi:predicted ribosome quality control (RQC) complex YloA/Tae2 family protein
MQPELNRGLVQRVRMAHLAGREVAVLDVRVPGETVYIVCAGGMGVGVVNRETWGHLREAMRASAPSPRQALWRTRLEGARIARVGVGAIDLDRNGNAWRAQPGRAEEMLLGPRETAATDAAERGTLEERGAAIADSISRIAVVGRHDMLRRALTKAIARVRRRAVAIQGDLARMDGAEALAQRARLFVAAAASASRGARKLTATDWSTGEARDAELPLDPGRDPAAQIDALFKRARRLKEGVSIAQSRLADAHMAAAKLEAALALLTLPDEDFDAIVASARAAAPHEFKLAPGLASGASRSRPDARRPPYRVFLGVSGARILVGRGAAHNDALTLHVARSHDLWLHAKNKHGAHVVVPLAKDSACPSDLLVEAAHLAAHFSDAREERVVEVQYTPRRYLRKPRGSAPGLVIVDREKVMILRKDDDQLRSLLATEVPA